MKPILFNTESVKAILDGRKSVTRRVMKPQPPEEVKIPYQINQCGRFDLWCSLGQRAWFEFRIPYQIGETLYVREPFREIYGTIYIWENGTYIPFDDFDGYQYKADNSRCITKVTNSFCGPFDDRLEDIGHGKWLPSSHMPKEAARLFLRVTDVRVERLQGITPEQLRAEGVEIFLLPSECKRMFNRFGAVRDFEQKKKEFAGLWDSAIKKADLPLYGWDANPWVWVIEFNRISKDEAFANA